MDRTTLAAYDSAAPSYAKRWLAQEEPRDLYALLKRYFRPGLTADIGCGSGRDTAWLNANGFPAIGYDPSQGLLAQASARYPQIEFKAAALPELAEIPQRHFDNVCCETVIMHLPREEIAPAVRRMITILKPGGVLFLSWRVTRDADHRDDRGRLYSAFDNDVVRTVLPARAVIYEEEVVQSGGDIHRLVARAG